MKPITTESRISKGKQLAINIAASFVALFVSMGINFFLSPFLVDAIGVEAYGFVQFSNNLISYFAVLSIALNSMSSRFISVAYFRQDMTEANQYFTSTFMANVLLSAVFLPIMIVAVLNMNRLLQVPADLVMDVQLLMGLMAVNFILGLLAVNLGISYYVTNKLYLFSIIQICGHLLRAVLLFVCYAGWPPYVTYIGLITLVVTLFTQAANLFWKTKLVPKLQIRKQYFSFTKVKQLIASGVWNAITHLGGLLSTGLDLLIANLMVSPTGMGVLSLAKIIPNLINTMLNTIIGTFLPNMTKLYAKKDHTSLVDDIKQAMKIIGMIINIPIALLIAYGDLLFKLWFPSQNAVMLQQLAIITVLPWAVIGQATIIHNVFTIVNRIRDNSLLVTLTGLLNVLLVFVLLRTTSLELYAIAGVSSVLSVVRNLLYTVPFGAKFINRPWYTFYPEIGKSILSVAAISGLGFAIKQGLPAENWLYLFVVSFLLAVIGFTINYLVVLNKNDRRFICDKIKGKLSAKGPL